MAKISSTDLDVYPIALGGNVFGWTANEEESFAVLDGYAAAGGNFIDTADLYSAWAPGNSGGESETILGRWIAKPRKTRPDDHRHQSRKASSIFKGCQPRPFGPPRKIRCNDSAPSISTFTTRTRTTKRLLSKRLLALLMLWSAKAKFGTSPPPIIRLPGWPKRWRSRIAKDSPDTLLSNSITT